MSYPARAQTPDTPFVGRTSGAAAIFLSVVSAADGYDAKVRVQPRTSDVEVSITLSPPGDGPSFRLVRPPDGASYMERTSSGGTVRLGEVPTRVEAADVVLPFSNSLVSVTAAWGIQAAVRSVNGADPDFAVVTAVVPLGSLTREGPRGELRAWARGQQRLVGASEVVACDVPAAARLDGFRAEAVKGKAVFTLHFAAAQSAVDAFGGRAVTDQRAFIRIAADPDRPTSLVGIVFDGRRKTANYFDATSGSTKVLGDLKLDVLGQNVLLKTLWRLESTADPLRSDGTLGTLTPSSLVQAGSTIGDAAQSCEIETATASFVQLDPSATDPATPALPERNADGVPPIFGGIFAFIGIGVITLLFLRARRASTRRG